MKTHLHHGFKIEWISFWTLERLDETLIEEGVNFGSSAHKKEIENSKCNANHLESGYSGTTVGLTWRITNHLSLILDNLYGVQVRRFVISSFG